MLQYVRVRKVGGSLMVVIPRDMAKQEALRPGEIVRIDIERPKQSGFGLLKGIPPFQKEDELDTHD